MFVFFFQDQYVIGTPGPSSFQSLQMTSCC